MTRRALLVKTVLTVVWICGSPTTTSAQSVVAGTVRDISGAALPGVAVEVSSAALIEKTRAATTDDQGRYRLEDLRPGMYAIRFTLKGWQPHRVQDIELTGAMNARIDAVLGPAPL